MDLREHLVNIFGLDEFRPSQREVIEDVLAGKDVLCVMPTGAGKSLCYQLPAAIQQGFTIVVSPLISLMEDQVQQLRDEGISAAMLNSFLDSGQQRQVLRELHEGFKGLLYVAPERFANPSFRNLVEKIRPTLFAIDEAHCISQWGHDFRPEYARLGDVRRMLGSPPTIALTATATEDVREDIIHRLQLRDPTVVVTGFDRPNLRYESRSAPNNRQRDDSLIDLLRKETGSGIIYCATRKAVEAVTALVHEHLKTRPVFAYHAGMESGHRTANQESWMGTPGAIAVATNAFGMGINKPDTRWVIHYNIPGTLEAYYQEAGRAGRDGLPARCIILFAYQDRYTQEIFISKIGEDNAPMEPDPERDERIEQLKEHARQKLDIIIRYAQTSRCRRQQILDYFGDPADVTNCHCDVCARGEAVPQEEQSIDFPEETLILVRQMLSAVARLNGKFGVGAVAEVLTGADTDRIRKWNLDQLTVYGLLRAHTAKRVVAMLHRLIEAGLARQRDPQGVKFMPVVELTPAGVAVMKSQQQPPASLRDLILHRVASQPRRQEIVIDLSPDARGRFERLRAIRLRLAEERQLPAYCICHDTTLKAIAVEGPRDISALELVKGMGPYKVKMYGEAFLQALGGA